MAGDIGNVNMVGTHYSTGKGKVNIEIAGTVPKMLYGQIGLGANTKIASSTTLNVTLARGFVPAPFQTFEIILVNGTITGDFGTKNFPSVPKVRFETAIVTYSIWQKYVISVVNA